MCHSHCLENISEHRGAKYRHQDKNKFKKMQASTKLDIRKEQWS